MNQMAPAVDVKQFLAAYEPVVTETAVWGSLPLSITYYLADAQPPRPYITSVRAVVFHQNAVLVVEDRKKEHFVVPGGRLDAHSHSPQPGHHEPEPKAAPRCRLEQDK